MYVRVCSLSIELEEQTGGSVADNILAIDSILTRETPLSLHVTPGDRHANLVMVCCMALLKKLTP